MSKMVMDVHEKPKLGKWFALSFQHLFAMFGATILVPLLTHLSPSIALLSSGLGTLAYLIITRGKIPAYLGSSFAFIYPILYVSNTESPGAAMFGCFIAGLVYGIVALLIFTFGSEWINRLLPPVVIGPVIIVIGLSLAGTAVGMAMNVTIDGQTSYSLTNFLIALATLGIGIVATIFFKGFFNVIPILLAMIGGYIISVFAGIVDFTNIKEAAVFAMPDFIQMEVSIAAIFVIVPVAIVTITEHIGHLMVTGSIMERDLVKNPGMHRSLLGDGVATMIAALIGGPPNTTYGENIGVLAITRIYSVFVIGGAAVIAVILAFFGKFGALITTIPDPVKGGVSILLFGIIASAGLRVLVDNKVDYDDKRNLVITSVILILGVGAAALKFEGINFAGTEFDIAIEGVALATIVGVILNAVLPKRKAENTDAEVEATE